MNNDGSNQSHQSRMTIGTGLRWTVLSALALAGAGSYPTYLLAGRGGLLAELSAGVIVVGVAFGALALIVRQAKFGVASMIGTYKFASMAKVLACAILAIVAKFVFDLQARPLLLWTAGFYVCVLACQSIWLVKSLKGFAPATSASQEAVGKD
jgi:hypothetical protein